MVTNLGLFALRQAGVGPMSNYVPMDDRGNSLLACDGGRAETILAPFVVRQRAANSIAEAMAGPGFDSSAYQENRFVLVNEAYFLGEQLLGLVEDETDRK